MPCGCHVLRSMIAFCPTHAAAPEMAGILNAVRDCYLSRPTHDGQPWPFVEAIDRILPRRGGGGG